MSTQKNTNRKKVQLIHYAVICFLGFCSFASYSQTLKSIADSKGIYVGNIIINRLYDNFNVDGGKPNQILRNEFNTTVLGNYMKMYAVLPNRPSNPFNFGTEALRKDRIDRFIQYCKTDDPSKVMRSRGHTLIWHSQAPEWLKDEAPGWTKEQVYDFTYHYIKAYASYCGEGIDEWDVLNEVIAPDHFDNSRRFGPFRKNTWFRKAANTPAELDEYFKFCFKTAREFAPHAKLYYNDFSIERYGSNSSKNGRMRAFVRRLVNMNTEIDAVGFQSHFNINFMASGNNANMGTINKIKQTMEEMDDLGLEVAVTELDIARCNGAGTDAGHKAAYKAYAKMALSQPNCNTFVIWGISDKDSWIPLVKNPDCDDVLIYDDNFNKKSAYFGVREALQEVSGQPNGGTNKIRSVSSPSTVQQGQNITIPVGYEASATRDIVVMFQLDTPPWTLYREVRAAVNKGSGTRNIGITIPSDVPVASSAYQFQTFLVSPGGGWGDRLSNIEKKNVSVISGDTGGPEGYTFAANEGGTVQVTGTVNIAYGADGVFEFFENITSDTPCNNATFGDPIPGVFKKCYIKTVSTNPPSGSCSFGTPTSTGLPSIANGDYSNISVLGNGPNVSNLKKFRIKWNAGDNKLTQFAFNTRNGNPSYYVDLRSKIQQNFRNSNPSVQISGSGIGVDGDYWVTRKGSDFVMVSKNGNYTLYFSTSSSQPSCSDKAPQQEAIATTVYPNPAQDFFTVNFGAAVNASVKVYNLLGQSVYETFSEGKQNLTIFEKLTAGMYLIRIAEENGSTTTHSIMIE